ncbi:NADP-binding Rossmann-like domain-containing protein [Fusarium mundagurra]|uniref:NADP-binding Rossmann-like domain-containing protein n=1 Tax=Fusarium mundagurra TaxID=1567541 RepID=A0A8H5XRZ4_9HYPO|nr:NADP-binding Rossmann-like domain-containing protein [Fusarium mundagurra]
MRDFLHSPLNEKKVIRHGKKYIRYEILGGDGPGASKTRVHFDDGSHEDCDVLISAEGSGSRANKQLGLNNIVEVKTMGAGGVLGKCHLPSSVLSSLPLPLLEKGTLFTSTASASIFAAAYLPDGLASSTQASSQSHDLSRATKPSEYDESQASLMVAITWQEGISSAEASQLPDKKEFLRKKLSEGGCHPDYLKLVDALDASAIQGFPVRTAKHTPVNWRQKALARSTASSDRNIANPRVWLMGDAIHPMLPSRGMGANQAIHDAADALSPLLELARQKALHGCCTDQQVQAQLALYEAAMIPRAFVWVKRSAVQVLPDLDSFRGKMMLLSMRIMLAFVGTFMGILKLFGWKPKDDAPELP